MNPETKNRIERLHESFKEKKYDTNAEMFADRIQKLQPKINKLREALMDIRREIGSINEMVGQSDLLPEDNYKFRIQFDNMRRSFDDSEAALDDAIEAKDNVLRILP